MMRPAAEVQMYLCREPIDYRRGRPALSMLVEQRLGLNPFKVALSIKASLIPIRSKSLDRRLRPRD